MNLPIVSSNKIGNRPCNQSFKSKYNIGKQGSVLGCDSDFALSCKTAPYEIMMSTTWDDA